MHKALDQLVSWGSDITRIEVNDTNTSWSTKNDVATPENTSGILDIAPATGIFGRGVYVLYKSQGKSKIYARFWRPNEDTNDGSMLTYVTSVACPTDARCIASVFDARGRSGLLIAAPDGLHYLNASEATSKDKPGKIIQATNLMKNIISLTARQDGKYVSLWYSNQNAELGYLRTTSDQLDGGVATLLLPAGQATSFAACISQPDLTNGQVAWQMLLSNDSVGNLTLLEQASDSGIWRRTPFYAPSNVANILVQSYTVTLHAKDSKGAPLKGAKIFIEASSSVAAIHNGQSTIIPQTGAWYQSDSNGTLNFIIATETLKIARIQAKDGTSIAWNTMTFDPAKKAMQQFSGKVASMKTAVDFRGQKTQKGESIFGKDFPDNDTLGQALGVLGKLNNAYGEMPADGSTVGAAPAPAIHEVNLMVAAPQPHLVGRNTVADEFWDAWEWVKNKVRDAYDWVVEKIGTFVDYLPQDRL
jgi:hypothetical protein